MRMYSVTESELNTLSVVNGLMALFFAIGSGIIGYGLDLHKDLLLAKPLPESAKVLESLIVPTTFIVGLAFYAFGLLSWFWRRSVILIMKRESGLVRGGWPFRRPDPGMAGSRLNGSNNRIAGAHFTEPPQK